MACFYGRRWHEKTTARDTRKRKLGTAAKAVNELLAASIAAMHAVEIRTEPLNLPRIPMVVRMYPPDVQTRQFALASAFALQAAHMLTAELHHIYSSPRGDDVRPWRALWVGGRCVALTSLCGTLGKTATHRQGQLHDQNVTQIAQLLLLV